MLSAARRRHSPVLDDAVRAHARWLGSAVDEVLRDGAPPTAHDLSLLRSLAASGAPACVTSLLPHLLHPDPVIRRICEDDLLIMGLPARDYLMRQRAAASSELRREIDRVWRQIQANGW